MDVGASYSGMPAGYPYDRERLHDRERLEYELTVRQEPKQARMCGVGADRRPIDPPPIIQLRVIDPQTRQPPSAADPDADDGDPNYAHSFLQNPYYFMFASLAKPDDYAELHWLKDGKTRCTTGSVVSSLYHLKDTENRNEDAGFFVFPDLSVRTEGSYRLKLSLFEVVGNTVRHCKSIYSSPFYVFTAKKFPGMEESTPLSCSLADQGIKIRIRKDIRVRKRPITALGTPVDGDKPDDDHDDEPNSAGPSSSSSAIVSTSTPGKRPRHSALTTNGPVVLGPPAAASRGPADMSASTTTGSVTLAGLPAWPTNTLDSMLGVASAPGGIELAGPSHGAPSPGGTNGPIPPPGATYEPSRMATSGIPPPPGAHVMNNQNGASYEGSRQNTMPSTNVPSSQRSQHIQSLTSSYTSATTQSVSPSGAVTAAPVYDAPGQRMPYEGPRPPYESGRPSYEQNPRATYESSRAGYDHPQQRGPYENARSGYDSQGQRPSYDTQRSSYASSYDAPSSGPLHSYQDAPPHVSYSNASGNYSGQNLPSPTHQFPQQTSSQHPPQHGHQTQYPPSTRSQPQFSAPPQSNGYGPPSGYPQGRYDYTATQHQAHYSGGGGGSAYYDNAASQPSPSSHAPSHSSQTHQQPPPTSYYGSGHPNSAPPSSTSSSSPWGGAAPPAPSQSYSSSSAYEYNSHPSQPYSTSSGNDYYASSAPSTHAASSAPRVASPAAPSSSSTTTAASATNAGRYSAAQQQSPYSGSTEGGYARSAHASFSSAYNLPPPGPPPPPSSSSSLANSIGTHHNEWTPSSSGWSAGASSGVSQHHQHQHPQQQQQQQQQQQEMIHLAPLRHTRAHAPSSSSSSSPSSPSLPSVVSAAGAGAAAPAYPGMIHLSRAPFEQETSAGLRGMPPGVGVGVAVGVGVGVPGKKSVLSIGSIISEGG